MRRAILRVLEGTKVRGTRAAFYFFTRLLAESTVVPFVHIHNMHRSIGVAHCNRAIFRHGIGRGRWRSIEYLERDIEGNDGGEGRRAKEGKGGSLSLVGTRGEWPTALNRLTMRQVPALRKPRSRSPRHRRFCTDRSSSSRSFLSVSPRLENTAPSLFCYS